MNIYKILQFFILLSDLWALISSVIFERKRSLNSPSTTSRLNFTLLPLSFVHYHLATTTSALALLPPTSPVDSAASPSPLLRDVGSSSTATAPSEARMQPEPPLPFLKGCGWLSIARWKIRGGRKTQGTYVMGGPVVSYEIRATTFVEVRFRHPSPYPPSLMPPPCH